MYRGKLYDEKTKKTPELLRGLRAFRYHDPGYAVPA